MFRFLFVAASMISVIAAAPAAAEQICGDRAKMVTHLDQNYHESRIGIGLASTGTVIELFAAGTGTWTMLMTAPDGRTCVLGTGEGWENGRQPKPAAGQPS